MSGSFDDNGALDIADGRIIVCVGKKRSGKSIMGKVIFSSYPGDKIVIDIAGDDGPRGKDVHEIRGTVEDLPERWPEHLRDDQGGPMTLRYVPDARSSTLAEDVDAVIAMADDHSKRLKSRRQFGVCVLVHEIGGEFAKASGASRHLRKSLMQNRHSGITLILCGPRPQTIDPLIIQQADVLYVFELMNPADRRRLAESIGWHPDDFDEAVEDLGPHEYLRFDANEMKPEAGVDDLRLIHFPRLPDDVVKAVK